MPSDQRQELLRWWVSKLDPGVENVDLVEVVHDLGICSRTDSTGTSVP